MSFLIYNIEHNVRLQKYKTNVGQLEKRFHKYIFNNGFLVTDYKHGEIRNLHSFVLDPPIFFTYLTSVFQKIEVKSQRLYCLLLIVLF